jgi:8-oxo-dGTP pyrophosphatase MutT (NUDIX family)
MLDDAITPARVLLVEHSYRRRGAWGLPGGTMDSIPGDPASPHSEVSPDDVLEATLSREIFEELGIEIVNIHMLRINAVPLTLRRNPAPVARLSISCASPQQDLQPCARGCRVT